MCHCFYLFHLYFYKLAQQFTTKHFVFQATVEIIIEKFATISLEYLIILFVVSVDIVTFFNTKYFVGNKAEGRISKRVFQENKVRQIFRKTNIFYPLIRTHRRIRG